MDSKPSAGGISVSSSLVLSHSGYLIVKTRLSLQLDETRTDSMERKVLPGKQWLTKDKKSIDKLSHTPRLNTVFGILTCIGFITNSFVE